jgi:hypothetical protein
VEKEIQLRRVLIYRAQCWVAFKQVGEKSLSHGEEGCMPSSGAIAGNIIGRWNNQGQW